MKPLITLLAFLPFIVAVRAQVVTIPDPEFVNFLQTNFPSCISGDQLDTQCADVLSTSYLLLPGTISDLYGIEFFTGLQTLQTNGPITNLTTIPNSVTTLTMYNSNLNVLPALPPNLVSLQITDALLDSLPPLPASLSAITMTDMYNLVHIPALPAGFGGLYLTNAPQLTSLPDLPVGMYSLSINYCPLLTVFPDFPTTLQNLHSVGNANIAQIPALPYGLGSLIVVSSPLLTSLPDLPFTLSELLCYSNDLQTLPALPPQLYELDFHDNPDLACLPILPESLIGSDIMTNLLDLSQTQITCLPNIPPAIDSTAYVVCMNGDAVNNPNGCEAAAGIHGYIYTDENANCIYDSGNDSLVSYAQVVLVDQFGDTISTSYSGTNGAYHFINLPSGQYNVILDTVDMGYIPGCSGPGIDSLVNLTGSNTVYVDFNVTCEPSAVNDIAVYSVLETGMVFPGTNHQVFVLAGNIFNLYGMDCAGTAGGELHVIIDGPVNYSGPFPGALVPDAVSGDTITYIVPDFSILSPYAFGITLTTETTATTGDQICIHAAVTSMSDPTPGNDSTEICYAVVNSYDPNMKVVYPELVLPGYDDWLTYTIYFQNTGNAPAMNIKLRDTLSDLVQLNTFQLLNSSHPMNLQILGNVAHFKFNDINLPDSTSDPEGSIGYVQYRIKPVPDLPDETLIENKVYIYFDYNSPIVTNTATTYYNDYLQTDWYELNQHALTVFPNPSGGQFNFVLPEVDQSESYLIEVFDVTGENMLTLVQARTETNLLNMDFLADGIYLVRITTAETQYTTRVVKQP